MAYLTVTVAFALGASAAHAASPSTVSISYQSSTFAGKVSSADADCRRGRQVQVRQAKPGSDSVVASDRTNRRGRWSARKSGAAGAFYATVKKTRGCKGARSKQLITGIARVEIAPAGILLTGDGDTQQLRAIARDASNRAIPGLPAATWSSNDGATVSASQSGLATAQAGSGSAQITARVAGKSSNPILATVAAPAPGALLITDGQVVAGPTLTDPEAAASFESTIDVILSGILLPEVGTLVINTESRPVVGRVVSAQDLGGGQIKLTLHLVSAEEAFPDLVIDETLDLRGAPVEIDPHIAEDYNVKRVGDEFTFTPKEATVVRYRRARRVGTPIGTSATLGPFRKCKGETTPGDGSLPVRLSAPPRFSVRFDPSLDILWSLEDELERLAVNLKPRVSVETGITIAAAFEGKIECKAELFLVRAPVGGALSFLIAGLIPIGVGVEASGKMNIADAGVSGRVEVAGIAEAGISCPPADPNDDCELIGTLDFQPPSVRPTLNAPSIGDARFEPGLSAFGYADLLVGNVFVRALRFGLAKAKAGAKLSGSFAAQTSQIAATDYMSSYKASLDASASLADSVTDAAQILGIGSLTGVEVKVSTDFANSPAGVLSADHGTFVTGDQVHFDATLTQVNFFPALGPYNVHRVVLVRDSGGTITEVASEIALPGETEFGFDFTAPGPGNVDEFYLFVVTNLIPFDLFSLELAQAKTQCADGIDNDGDTKIDYPADPECESAGDGSEAAPVSVSVSPSSTTVAPGGTRQFTATVENATDTSVTWTATCGSISASGLYTAPSAETTCTVTATSAEDPTKSGTATVTVSDPGNFAVTARAGSFGANAEASAGSVRNTDTDSSSFPGTPLFGEWVSDGASASASAEEASASASASGTSQGTLNVTQDGDVVNATATGSMTANASATATVYLEGARSIGGTGARLQLEFTVTAGQVTVTCDNASTPPSGGNVAGAGLYNPNTGNFVFSSSAPGTQSASVGPGNYRLILSGGASASAQRSPPGGTGTVTNSATVAMNVSCSLGG